ncbi:unnamed protein product [Cylicostephanus goldi]|uniref:Uncharacterized protein n=1 Tax=Cylicostephanus goldi TaxID=71465 RepID=A0A3P6UG51_CYLGO|nr:unnamed protein product [Cylicostephanus goldi]
MLTYLVREFGCCEEPRTPCRMERIIIDNFAAILREAKLNNLEIEAEEETIVEEMGDDPLWTADDGEWGSKGEGSIRCGEIKVSEEMVCTYFFQI